METKDSLKVNIYGQAILSSDELRELVLQGKNIGHLNVVFDDDINMFLKYQDQLLNDAIVFLDRPEELLSFDDFHKQCADQWIFPELYQKMEILPWLLKKCQTQQQIDRVRLEYQMYIDRDLEMLLKLFIYLVDYMREKSFVWGVGRGSSVSSYILFLIGIHHVDSIKYSLDIKDYLK
jgi:DNA polymerase III alpha subunit